MKKRMYFLSIPLALVASVFLFSASKKVLSEEEKAIEAAILDYVEGIYEMDTTRIYRSVHPELEKRGYYFSDEKDRYSKKLEMSFEQLVDLTKGWNKNGQAGPDALKKIDIYTIHDKTASAKLTAYWGLDFMHLAKIDDKWMIMNVLWQTPPR
ncbi:MAG: nuclear transport factor 2 family protein [Bacteroidota bacterium]